MNFILLIALAAVFVWVFSLNREFRKEQRSNRVLLSFVSGTIRAVSDYRSLTDSNGDDFPVQNERLPIPYKDLLASIEWEFYKDFWIEPYKRWLQQDRGLFDDPKYGNDGFNMMYLDIFDRRVKEWTSETDNPLKSTNSTVATRIV